MAPSPLAAGKRPTSVMSTTRMSPADADRFGTVPLAALLVAILVSTSCRAAIVGQGTAGVPTATPHAVVARHHATEASSVAASPVATELGHASPVTTTAMPTAFPTPVPLGSSEPAPAGRVPTQPAAPPSGTAANGPAATPAPLATAAGQPFRVVGRQILRDGVPFVPYGVEVPSLWVASWRHNAGMQHNVHVLQQPSLYATIRHVWHANTIAIKVASADLFDRQPVDQAYLAAIDGVVSQAHAYGMQTIIALQYESTTRQRLPTEDSLRFWQVLARRYAGQPWVFFDLFNEARNPAGGPDDPAVWNRWQHGGTVGGRDSVGMQTLVDTVRAEGNTNLLFADGLAAGEDLNGVPTHLLRGGNVVYAVHPYFNATQHATPAEWDRWFGNVATAGDFPVTADEWGEYQSNSHGACFPAAAGIVPRFLTYLHHRHIGLIGYGLYPGILIRGWNFADPTAFHRLPNRCTATSFPNFDQHAQGAGQLLIQFFAANSAHLPPRESLP